MATNKVQLNALEQGQFSLSGELTRDSVADSALLSRLLQNTHPNVQLDLSAVTHVDTAGLAWLIHCLSELKKHNQQLKLHAIPQQLTKLMQLGQVSDLFK